MNPRGRPCCTNELLAEMKAWEDDVSRTIRLGLDNEDAQTIRYAVCASKFPGYFNLGGDLEFFSNRIRAHDRAALLDYAISCIDVAYRFHVAFNLPITTIALVQGKALGGGFEAALAANVLIAEKGSSLGFPEVLFNLFPGMGAYSFLSRRTTPSIAERLILSGNTYSAEYLYDLGVVDVLAESGRGEDALREYIRQSDRRENAHNLLRSLRAKNNQAPYEELIEIGKHWVDSAMKLSDREISKMERLVRLQWKHLEPRYPTNSASAPKSQLCYA